MTVNAGPADIERALGRVVVGYRIVGAIWLAVLAVITLAGSARPERPAVVVATTIGIGGWAALTGWLHASRPAWLASSWWLTLDVGVAIWTLFSGDVAGTTSTFYGGYPMSTVFIGVYTFALPGGLATAAALSTATILHLPAVSDWTSDSGAILIYLFSGALAGWAVGVIRRFDRRRREAEEALTEERASRARAEERAEMAAHLHDSVLQTLALIQRSGTPEEATALARRQERELRAWLFGGSTSPDDDFSAAVRAMTAEVEDLFPVRVETVVVGDAPIDDAVQALLNAAREACINAARHAGVDVFSVYAEAQDGVARVFVRDRGVGFEPGAVPADRKGIAESIERRMERHRGSAVIRSRPGGGTEVILELEVGE